MCDCVTNWLQSGDMVKGKSILAIDLLWVETIKIKLCYLEPNIKQSKTFFPFILIVENLLIEITIDTIKFRKLIVGFQIKTSKQIWFEMISWLLSWSWFTFLAI